MVALKLLGFMLIAVTAVQLARAELQEGSGDESADVANNELPPVPEDYVMCPPDGPADLERNMMGDVEESEEDYYTDYDAPWEVPESAALPNDGHSVDNVTVEVVAEDLLTSSTEVTTDEDDSEVVPAMVIEAVAEDSEEAKDDGELPTDSAELVQDLSMSNIKDSIGAEDFPTKLIKSPRIYSVSDSETPEVKFAAYRKDNPGDIELTSPNYPDPYPNNVDEGYQEFNVSEGIGVQITIHALDLDPKSDYLHIRGGGKDDTDEKGPVITGTLKEPLRFLISHTTTFSIKFVSNHDAGSEPNTHTGYRLTYAPFGTVVEPTTTTTTEPPVLQEELEWIRKEISISRTMMLSVETWPLVKTILSNATNVFIEEHKLRYKPCRPEDLRIVAQKCPDTWPKYDECVTLRLAIPLRPEPINVDESAEGQGLYGRKKALGKSYISVSTTEEPKAEYQLSEANLERMWNQYGAMALAETGIEAYRMPENSAVLLIWIAISLCIILAFIFVLYSIWKIDFFKDYRRISKMSREAPDDDRNELKKKEFDISMFPSPHQIVPSLFPTGDPYSERNTEAQYAYDNSTMNPWADETFEAGPQPPKTRPKQQVFEPLSPGYSPSIIDFNDTPEPRSPRRSRINPFLPPGGGHGAAGDFNQAGSRP